MRSLLLAALACAAVAIPVTAHAAPADCVTAWLGHDEPAPEFVSSDGGKIVVDPSAGDPIVIDAVTFALCLA